MRDSSEVPLKQEEIKSVEDQVKERYKNVELAVRKNIPEYDLILNSCQEPIETYEKCMLDCWTKPTPATCQRERIRKEDCVSEAACPQIFKSYVLCMSGDKRTCHSYKKALDRCIGDIADKVQAATRQELTRLRKLDKES